jgi:capsular polysaccharide biosynthesis protein
VELKSYAEPVRRHWQLVLLITLAVFAVSVFMALRGPWAYTATMRLAISVMPDPRIGEFFKYDGYYALLSSEYLADDLSEVLKSQAFAQDVSAETGFRVDPSQISNLTRTKKTHRLLDVTVYGSTREGALEVAEAMERVLNTKLSEYFAFLNANNGYVRIINRPEVSPANSRLLTIADIALRTVAGLFVAVGLAFLLEYLDPSFRDRRQVETLLGAPVLGEIPAT